MPTVVRPASRKVVRVLLPLSFLFLFPPVLRAQPFEPIVVAVLLNGQPEGEVFALRTPEGDFFLKAADLRKMGLGDLPGEAIVLDGEPHLSLRSLKGAEFSFDERTLALSLTLPPELFPPQTLDFLPPRRTDVYYPRDTSAFLNYGVGYTAGDSFSFRERDASLQLGGRHREFLFLTDFSFTETREEENFVRLQTSLSRDRRETLEQTVLGDFFADSGELGASLHLGGISYSKVYRIDPYLQRYPLGGFASAAKYPSEIEVYLDGTLIRKERVGPGEFELSNLSYYGGAREVSVLIRDPFGTPFMQQDNVWAPDADHRWLGSIAMDKNGNIGLGYSVSSATTFPSIRYTGRLAGDALGTMREEKSAFVGGGSQTSTSNRWGDYSSMNVDPDDDMTFWYTQEYYASTSSGNFSTGVVSFAFPAGPEIFADGFESGDVSAWSNSTP